jgi:hypothetical protein
MLGEPEIIALNVPPPGHPGAEHGGISVRYATRRGRDAANDRDMNSSACRMGEQGASPHPGCDEHHAGPL